MSDDGGVVRTTREITVDDQRALVSQCTRCLVRDMSWWVAPAALAGVVTGLLVGRGAVLAVFLAAAEVVAEVVVLRRRLRAAHPVGATVETVLEPHRLTHLLGSLALPQVTDVRAEGRVVRVDHGKDHTHLLPTHVDLDLVRQRAGVPAPTPVPGPSVVVVPSGCGARAAARFLLWRTCLDSAAVTAWLGAVGLGLLGFWAMSVTVLVSAVGRLLVTAAVERRQLDRALPAGVPLEREWRGTDLVVRGAHGESVVVVGEVTGMREHGDTVVVRRRGLAPLVLPAVLVGDSDRPTLPAN